MREQMNMIIISSLPSNRRNSNITSFIFYIFRWGNRSLIHYVFQIVYTIHRTINFRFTIIIIIITIIITTTTAVIIIIIELVNIFSYYFRIMSASNYKIFMQE